MDKDKGKVVNLQDLKDPNKQKDVRSQSAAPAEKITQIELFNTIALMMNGGNSQILPAFPDRFALIKDTKGERRYLQIVGLDVVVDVNPARVMDSITRYSMRLGGKYRLKPSAVEQCFKHWAAITDTFELEIAPVRQLSEQGYTWHRLPFDFQNDSLDECPLFSDLMERTTNASALMAWIGSLFDPDADRQQYVWLYGEGSNGKGTLARLLAKLMGPATIWEFVPERDNRFWTSSFIGKRLAIFGDCNNYKFPTTGLFKSLTGGDGIRIERKNGPVISVDLETKFMFLSNEKPDISGATADRRRAIFCTFEPIREHFGRSYEQDLWMEAPIFVKTCIDHYFNQIDHNGSIPTDESAIQDLIEDNENDYETFVEQYLNIVPESHDPSKLCSTIEMKSAFDSAGIKNNWEKKRYYEYMERKHDIKIKQLRSGDSRKRVFTNCTRRYMGRE